MVRALLLIGTTALAAVAAPAEWLARFEDPARPLATDLSGEVGGLDSAVERDPGGFLRIAADLGAGRSYGGAWLSLRGPSASSHVTLDLPRWAAIRFRARALGEQPLSVRIELKDSTRLWSRTAYRYAEVAPGPEWHGIVIPTSLGAEGWSGNGERPDLTHAKELVLVLDADRNPTRAVLEIDDLELLGEAPGRDLTDGQLLRDAAYGAFRFYHDYADPRTGLIPDRSDRAAPYTIAGTGFALAAECIGAERGWVTRAEAAARVRTALRYLASAPMGPEESGAIGHRGLYYHFLGPDGLRSPGSELSTIDTALALWGVLCAEGWFDREDEADISELARRLVARADWRWMLDERGRIRHGWRPEEGGTFLGASWDCYTDEALLASLLASEVAPETLWSWERVRVTPTEGEPFVASYSGSLFTYFFASLWLPPEVLERPDAHPSMPVSWRANARAAVEADLRLCRARLGPVVFGLSACEGRVDGQPVYHAYGSAPCLEVRDGRLVPRDAPHLLVAPDGSWREPMPIVAPYAAAGASLFLREESLTALRHYRQDLDLWRGADVGLADAFDPVTGWANRVAYAIDAGPLLLALDARLAWDEGRPATVPGAAMRTETARRAVARLLGEPAP